VRLRTHANFFWNVVAKEFANAGTCPRARKNIVIVTVITLTKPTLQNQNSTATKICMRPNGSDVWILVNADPTEAAAPSTVGEEQRQRMQPWLKIVAPREKRFQTFHHLGP